MPYAERTVVPVAKSKAEVEGLIEKYGGTKYQSGWDSDRALVAFEAEGRRVRFVVQLPHRADFGNQRAFEQEQRRISRALCLVIKAKLESWESGIESFDEAFLGQIVLPGQAGTIAEWVAPQLADAYRLGSLPAMLPLPATNVLALPAPKDGTR